LMTSEEQTREAVRSELPYKPDFIKIWYIVRGPNIDSSARINLPFVKAVIDEAHKNNLFRPPRVLPGSNHNMSSPEIGLR